MYKMQLSNMFMDYFKLRPSRANMKKLLILYRAIEMSLQEVQAGKGGGGGDSHIKRTAVFVVPFRGLKSSFGSS